MKTIDEIQIELNKLIEELEQLKQSEVDEQAVDHVKISARSKRYPIEGHPLLTKDNYTKKKYFTLLLSLAQYDDEHIEDSFMLVYRIAWGAEYISNNHSLNEEYLAGKTVTFKQLDEWTDLFKNDELKMVLMLEMLMMAGLFNKGRTVALEYIADLCVLLNIDKVILTFLSNMAKVILTGDLKMYGCNINNEWNIFDCYLRKLSFEREIFTVEIPRWIKTCFEEGKKIPYFLFTPGDGPVYLSLNAVEVLYDSINKKVICRCKYGNKFYGGGEYKEGLFFDDLGLFVKAYRKADIVFDVDGFDVDGKVVHFNSEVEFEQEYSRRSLSTMREDDINIVEKITVGVLTHPLDSKNFVQKFYDKMNCSD